VVLKQEIAMLAAAAFDSLEQHTGRTDADALVHVLADNLNHGRSLAALIELSGWRVATHESIQAFLAESDQDTGCLVCDAHLLGIGQDDTRRERWFDEITLPIVLIGRSDVSAAVQAIKSGAIDFLAKPINAWALFNAIDQAVAASQASRAEQRYVRSLRAASLQFPLGHPAVAAVIPGAVAPGEAERNVATLRVEIPAALWAELKHEGLLHADAPVPG
jgi:FixJ family two-component response regulator